MKREFLQLAQVYNPDKHGLAGWLVSEKLDGMRAFWDGGVSRGMSAHLVPYSNTAKDKSNRIATGLWSRYCKVITPPGWWLDALPPIPLDGELFAGRGNFQKVMSTVKDHVPTDSEWKQIGYMVFDSPAYPVIFATGRIKNINVDLQLDWYKIQEFLESKGAQGHCPMGFESILNILKDTLTGNKVASLHEQVNLPYSTSEAHEEVMRQLDTVTSQKGEGLIVRKPGSIWAPERTWSLLKVKPYLDAEGIVTGFWSGLGKFEGMLGSLELTGLANKVFTISGFTDAERSLTVAASQRARKSPGVKILDDINPSERFKVGDVVTFKYRELTDDGMPKEARFFRTL